METSNLMLQDLSDLLHINIQRVDAYNKHAYLCSDIQLKNLLNREVDTARDNVSALKRVISTHFDERNEKELTGQLFCMWKDFSPSFDEPDFAIQLHAYEMSDFLTLECYQTVLARPYLDPIVKLLLECQYYNTQSIYTNMSSFREAYAHIETNKLKTSV